MDRQGISSPVFHNNDGVYNYINNKLSAQKEEQDDDMNSFVTKSHLFGAQRALHQEQQAMSERIDNLAADLPLSEQCTRDYFDHKLDAHKQENDARMDEIRALLLNRSSSTSRWSRSSRHSDFTLSGSSTPT